MIIYDCEIVKAIQSKNEERIEDIEYCEGWRDFENMGVSIIGAYDYDTSRYRVFAEDNFDQFQELVDSTDLVIGFNSLAFDNQLCAANGIMVDDEESYDLLVEIWKAAGLGNKFKYPSHAGYSLDTCAEINFGVRKTGHGTFAPVDWQKGNIGAVVDYCLNDVYLTKLLVDHIIDQEWIKSPKNKELKLCVDRSRLRIENYEY